MEMIKDTASSNFTTSFLVDQSPREAFNAITNVRGWWSESVEGNSSQVHDEFDYHYEDLHRCKMRLIEVVADQKVVWLVLDNYFKFTEDKTEWIGNTLHFEISQVGDQTQVVFTQVGLVPAYECFDICRDAWTNYIQNSLRSLITTGVGLPNGKGKPRTAEEAKRGAQDYHARIQVPVSAAVAFEGINKVPAWWSQNFEGAATQVEDVFTVSFGETWISIQIVEMVPSEKVHWLVVDCHKHWLQDPKEWKGTWMMWELATVDGATQIDFTHVGLVPGIECYNGCEKAWDFYIQESLQGLLTEGKGMPELRK